LKKGIFSSIGSQRILSSLRPRLIASTIRDNLKLSEGAFAFLVLFFLTFSTLSVPFSVGLDPSWQFAMNYAFEHGLIFGKDIIFTYGPLGFILAPGPMQRSLIWANAMLIISTACLILSLIALIKETSKDNTSKRYINYIIAYILIILIKDYLHVKSFDIVLLSISIILSILYHSTKKPIYLCLSAPILAVSFLYKFGVFVMCVSINLYNYYKTAKNRKYKIITAYLSVLICIFLPVCIYFFKNLENLYNYVRGSYELSYGYFSAISSGIHNNILALPLIIMLFFTFYLTKNKLTKWLILSGAPFLWLTIKYSLCVEGPWFMSFLAITILVYALITLIILCEKEDIFSFLKRFTILWFILIIFNISADMTLPSFTSNISKNIIDSLDFKGLNITEIQSQMNYLKYQTAKNLSEDSLPISILEKVANSTVDVYPWETSVIGANNLNWDPRPIFQSYTDYTPWLDNFNNKFLNSDRSPEYYLWFKRKTRPEITSLRGRMLFNDDPQTILDILRNYQMVMRENEITLLKKNPESSINNPKTIDKTNTKWDTWLKIPYNYKDTSFILLARVNIKRNMLGIITRFLYKEEPIFIEYKDIEGKVHKYRLSPDNAIDGVWITPLPVSLNDKEYFITAIPIKEFKILNSNPYCYEPDITITWEKIEVLNKRLIKVL
jgi:hypothetical protein